LLTFNVNGSIETIITGAGKGLTSTTIGTDAVLTIPRFIVPFFNINPPTKFVPKTEFRFGYQKLSEIRYYNLNTFSFSAGYHWNQTERKEHLFNPIVVNFLKLGNTSHTFDSILNRNISLKRSFATQFIIGSYYSYTYNTQVTPERKFDIFFNGTVDVAGNVLGLVQSVFKDYKETPSRPYTLFGEPYAQYVLGMVDLRHYLNITTNKQYRLASRIFTGVGVPYGNSGTLPYIKEFFTGGNNSVRAFPSRFLGPGSYQLPADRINSFFVDQIGDIKLEGNLEYRFPIAGPIKGAVFTDAGNIWLLNEDTARPGGKFNFNTFYKEIAVGTGFGIRVDASFFVLRFDIAFPLRRAYATNGDNWVIDAIRPLDPVWRNKNLVLNIGIGYPF
jgi:outer membrane protein insertion porin family